MYRHVKEESLSVLYVAQRLHKQRRNICPRPNTLNEVSLPRYCKLDYLLGRNSIIIEIPL